ncbi:hypothetical protein A4U64_07250 [Rhodococcus sp. WB1]|uniref:Uncharacterized protein n=1 Tax=Rhodococcus aetherivorans TaxID=191292 RepID=A0AA46SFX6_9NOCA|nr:MULTISPECIES: hypothetical protein [Rhodococcus]AKE90728.1 hypothetical protein AAT18_17460 [Rhodococcus aetherivorans]ANZ24521.1 hypothetical protein A4U64_07250 [Rhodococcus sp. WB1]MBC2588363.1 hypothetical protein [Rhodococcus aetherivorans]UGQ43103.1 hypothetical protein LRQ66_07335 [Rhodococcus aetherivorans]UYF96291.1 hypothetical protein OCS65_11275 [Rhodococcus aetherivorans]
MNARTPLSPAGLPLRDTRYRTFEQYPEFATATAWLRDYVRAAVPNPRMSEREYWSVVCLPPHDGSIEAEPLVSVHVGAIEAAGLYVEAPAAQPRRIGGRVTVAVDDLEAAAGTSVDVLAAAHSDLRFRPDGPVVSIGWSDGPASRAQFAAVPWEPAAAALVGRVMRNGKCRWSAHHCAQLARFALAD